ncbi:MAG: L,D-transpeptidase [Ornithinimicrobium sp.]
MTASVCRVLALEVNLGGHEIVVTNAKDAVLRSVIGIHGTNEPDLAGTDVNSGCIRLPNSEITTLVDKIGLPLGTPVTIRA